MFPRFSLSAFHRALLVVPLVLGMAMPVTAEVVGIQIDRREVFAEGQPFGRSGLYEKITGKLLLEVEVTNPANQRVTDLKLAPRNAQGKVAFWTDFFLLMPADPSRGNRRLLYDVNNRGNKVALSSFNNRGGNNPTTKADAGNGFLMREGYTVLWCGWNGDAMPGNDRLQIGLPIARKDGKTITGKIYAEITVDQKAFSRPFYWGNSVPYSAVSLDHRTATLTMRPLRSSPPTEVPHDQWSFARWEDGKAIPDPTHLYLKEGFRPGWLYDLVYEGKDPKLAGLGFAAVRDAVSFFRFDSQDKRGRPNPLAGTIEHAYIYGVSQSGRFINHFLYDGFNGDEKDRTVFDAAFVHVAGGGKGQFNYRFAQTTRHGSHHEDNLFPSDFFPFNSTMQEDPVTGERGDTLTRARNGGHLPRIFMTQTSSEYWARAASLVHTDVEGKLDAELDSNVRLYFFASAQHGVRSSSARGIYRNPINVLDYRPLLRALLVALDRWVTTGEEPPESRYPRISDGGLVSLESYRRSFPRIPGVSLPESFFVPLRLDPGGRWQSEGIADHVPPRVNGVYQTRVPAADEDGNARAGIRLPDLAVPLATYTGWNTRSREVGAEGMLARWSGSYLTFSGTSEERRSTGDARPSVRERYPTRASYLSRYAEAVLELQRQRFLLGEDVVEILNKASRHNLW